MKLDSRVGEWKGERLIGCRALGAGERHEGPRAGPSPGGYESRVAYCTLGHTRPPHHRPSPTTTTTILTIFIIITRMAPSTPKKNKQARKRQASSRLTTPNRSKRARKEHNTLVRSRYFETLARRNRTNQDLHAINQEFEISDEIERR